MKIVQISDTHVLAGGRVTAGNTERVVEFVNGTLRPDLVVHTGDVVGLSPDDEVDRSAAVAALAQLRAPVLVVPGNHDVGSPGEAPWMGFGVTHERIAGHGRVFGTTPFLERVGGWDIVGLNSQLFGSGLLAEDGQWDWIERTLARPDGPPLLVFLHRPLWNHRPSRPPDGNSLPRAARERLLALPGSARLRAVGSGHLHWYRPLRRAQLLEVWGPAVGFAGATYEDAVVFAQCGVAEWRLDGESIEVWFRAPVTLDERQFLDVPEIAARIGELERERERAA